MKRLDGAYIFIQICLGLLCISILH